MSNIDLITKLADLEAEIIELENLIKDNIDNPNKYEKILLWRKDLIKLKTMKTKVENKLNKEMTKFER